VQTFRKILDKVTMFFVRISGVALAIVALLVIVSVIKRAIFGAPIKGMVELVQYGVMFAIVMALSRTTLNGAHTRVTMFTQSLPDKGQKVLDFIIKLLSLAMFCLLCYRLVLEMNGAAASRQVTEIFKIPFRVIYGILAFGVALNVIVVIFQSICSFMNIFKGPAPPASSGADERTEES